MLAVVGMLLWRSCGMATAAACSAAMSAGSTVARMPGGVPRIVAASARTSARAAYAGWGMQAYIPATVLLRRIYALIVIEHGTRRVHLAGITANPDGAWSSRAGGRPGPAQRHRPADRVGAI